MSAIVEALAGKTRETLRDLSETIVLNLKKDCKTPTSEDLFILHRIIVTEIQDQKRNSSNDGQSVPQNSESYHELDEILLRICREFLHLLCHTSEETSPSFAVISKCVLICFKSATGCRDLVREFLISNIREYVATVKYYTKLPDTREADLPAFYQCPKGDKVSPSLVLQLLHVLSKESPQVIPSEPTNLTQPNLKDDAEIFEALMQLIHSDVDDAVLAVVSQIIKIHLCNSSKKKALWKIINNLSCKESEKIISYGMACLVIDEFLCGTENDIRNNGSIREFIQCGLISDNSLTRKRAMYILKRVIDAPKNACVDLESWMQLDDFILLFETLEEKQLHVMLPVLPSVDKVIQLSREAGQSDGKQGSHLHISWLTTILTRAINHESKVITRWAVEISLHLKVDDLQFFKNMDCTFICNRLINAFKEFYLFEKEDNMDVSQPPTIVGKLESFFEQCKYAAAKECQEVTVFRQVFKSLFSSECSSLTFPYVLKALSCVEINGLVDLELLSTIKAWMLSETSTYPAQLKAATFGILLRIVCSSLSEEISLVDLIKFSRVIFDSGYLTYGTEPWFDFLSRVSRKLEHLRWGDKAAEAMKSSSCLCQLFKAAFGDFLNGKSLEFESEVEIVLLFFLTIDSVCKPTEGNNVDQLNAILSPLVVAMGQIGRNPYVTPDNISRCISVADLIIRCCFHSKDPYQFAENKSIRCMIMRKVLEQTRHCLSMFCNSIKEAFFRNELDVCAVLPFLKLHKTVCTFLNDLNNLDGSHSLISHLEIVCKLCCQHADTFTEVTDIRVINLAFQLMKAMCDVVRGRCFESYKETKNLLEKLLLGTIRNLNLKFESYYSRDHLKDASCTRNQVTTDALFFEAGRVTNSLWYLVSFAVANSDIRSAITSKSQSQEQKASYLTLKTSSLRKFVNVLVETIDITVGKDIVPILHCLELLIHDIVKSSDDLANFVLDTVWRVVMEQERRDSTFWKIYKPSINVIFHSSVLFSGSKVLLGKVRDIWCILEDSGKSKCGLFNVVVERCCDILNNSILNEGCADIDFLKAFLDLITNACVFGQVQKKVSRIVQQAVLYFTAHYKYGIIQSNNINVDYKVRWSVIRMLLNASEKMPFFVNNVMQALIEKDRKLSEQSKRYYDNSLIHRQKLRIWQTMLVLCKSISEDSSLDIVTDALSVMVSENQPSIRYYIEWFVVIMINKNTHLRSIIWDRLKEATERRVCSVTCLMSIVAHLTVVIDDDEFPKMATEAFSKLLPWVQIHHMQARVHAQVVIWKLWEEAKRRNCIQVLRDFSIIESLFSLSESNASVFKATKELRNHFYFNSFHPIRHYSLETIFCIMPKLLKVGEDEIISRAQLTEVLQGEGAFNQLKVFDENPSLIDAVNSEKSVKSDDVFVSSNGTNSVDVQKKITAWKPLPPTEDPFLQKAEMYKKEMKRSQMILCASLIDRTPNLGGLCRTCEIFGVETLVIGAMRYLDDANFKCLSVTAEKWMNIEQVLPRHLKVYLEEMKNKGYRLVGIEQTANSKSLQDYEFQEKTILLLGNEREGIPVNLIQMLDDCVEIPQQGVIRSLNVHVSGAIVIWEYCRQRLLKRESKGNEKKGCLE